VGNGGGSSVSRGGRKGKTAKGREGLIEFVAVFGLQKRGKRKGARMVTAVSRTAGGEVAAGERSRAPWRTRGRTPGKVYSGDRSRGDAWEGAGRR
jgi:hypothetical protein